MPFYLVGGCVRLQGHSTDASKFTTMTKAIQGPVYLIRAPGSTGEGKHARPGRVRTRAAIADPLAWRLE